jgi:hypothetical protein
MQYFINGAKRQKPNCGKWPKKAHARETEEDTEHTKDESAILISYVEDHRSAKYASNTYTK